ncbi:MAG: phosphodiester glycosidase family protein [Clostridia bacterium]|nr:phosphodiester glycosidase family protein [Clostridia bacterium]
MTKKFFALLISIILVFSALPSFAETSTKNADRLNTLGLFRGTDSGYALEGSATRIHALIMLIRLLGEEDEALAYKGECPFTDITADTYKLYAGYAYSKGYTSGTGNNTFTPDSTVTFRDYTTFLLRALGYSDKAGDFTYKECFYLAALIGLIEENSAYILSTTEKPFYRADMVDLSVSALTTNTKNSDTSLATELLQKGVFSKNAAQSANILTPQESYHYTEHDYSTTFTHHEETFSLPSGKVTANVIYVNLKNPSVKVKAAIANNTIGTTLPFSDIVAGSNAKVIVNANFFEAYASIPYPVGHIMAEGQFLYGVSGMYSFGFTKNNEITVGSPSLFFTVTAPSASWSCYELNSQTQTADYSVIYTPAFGKTFTTKCPAMTVTVENGVITNVNNVSTGTTVSIPQTGYVMFLGTNYTKTHYFATPTVGTPVTMAPTFFVADKEGFTLDDVTTIVSGGPRLVKNGAIYNTLEAFYNEARFTTMATTRTAIGRDSKGNLYIISTPRATIGQLKELMLHLGCTDAINLDGGASTALAIDGSILRSPGRNLATTLQIFVEN